MYWFKIQINSIKCLFRAKILSIFGLFLSNKRQINLDLENFWINSIQENLLKFFVSKKPNLGNIFQKFLLLLILILKLNMERKREIFIKINKIDSFLHMMSFRRIRKNSPLSWWESQQIQRLVCNCDWFQQKTNKLKGENQI